MVIPGAGAGLDCKGTQGIHEPSWGLLIFCISVWMLFIGLDSVCERSSDCACMMCTLFWIYVTYQQKVFCFGFKENSQVCISLGRMRTQMSDFFKVLGVLGASVSAQAGFLVWWLEGTCGDLDVFAIVLAFLPGAAFRDCHWICALPVYCPGISVLMILWGGCCRAVGRGFHQAQ